MREYSDEAPINVGWGRDISIAELARLVADTVGFKGELRFDPSKPDGTPRKLLDTSRLTALGWQPKIPLAAGLASTYDWFRAHQEQLRR
jgi:GDP-L-fucose synthase